ncbi:MAG TPA: hypothetical protein VGO11_00620 [Chthoniobacteraceae bacterium]|jgi:hypothetical protein|nr:hypothetical protein [Chthoniobacteraceae bacterium]
MRLTRDEIILITCILLALLSGAIIKRYRDRARALAPAAQQVAPTPSPKPPDREP